MSEETPKSQSHEPKTAEGRERKAEQARKNLEKANQRKAELKQAEADPVKAAEAIRQAEELLEAIEAQALGPIERAIIGTLREAGGVSLLKKYAKEHPLRFVEKFVVPLMLRERTIKEDKPTVLEPDLSDDMAQQMLDRIYKQAEEAHAGLPRAGD